MADVKALPTAIERILGRGAQRPEPADEDVDIPEAFAEVRAPRYRGREALMLDVRRADGACFGMSYAYLIRIDFEPGDRLRLVFADGVVQVGGRRLRDLYRRLLEHRVDAIQEGTVAEEGLKAEEEPHIDHIQLFTRSEDRYDHEA